MKNKIIFVRHGQSVANKEGIIADKTYPLKEDGLLQIKETANELLKDIEKIDLIISSPYIRAVQTAEVFADECNNHPEIIMCESLRERGLSELEGKPKTYDS